MKSISLNQARELGFEPKNYSPYPPIGEMVARIDFSAWLYTTETLFFRQDGTGIRSYVQIGSSPSIETMPLADLQKFFPYVQRGDLCRLTIAQSPLGVYVLQHAEIIEQVPLCNRRRQCQRSACCVFKN